MTFTAKLLVFTFIWLKKQLGKSVLLHAATQWAFQRKDTTGEFLNFQLTCLAIYSVPYWNAFFSPPILSALQCLKNPRDLLNFYNPTYNNCEHSAFRGVLKSSKSDVDW